MVTVVSTPKTSHQRLDVTYDTRVALPIYNNSRATATYVQLADKRTTNQNPNWKVQVARGTDASTSYLLERNTIRPGKQHAEVIDIQPSYRKRNIVYDNVVGLIPTTPSVASSALSSRASEVMRRKLRSQTGQMNALVPLAELKEMRGLVKNMAALTSNLLQDLIHIRKTRGKSALAYASNAWLTFNFGVSPTIGSINEVSDSIEKYLNREDASWREIAFAYEDWVSSTTNQGTGAMNHFLVSTGSFKWKRSVKLVGGWEYLLKSSNNYGISDHLGLTLGNLVPTAWELVPYSWALDYFTTMGSYLEDTFSADFGTSKYLVECRRLTCEGTFVYKFKNMGVSTSSLLSEEFSPGSYKYFGFQRVPLANLPRSQLRLRTVDEVGRHALSKVLNLASILGAKLRRQ